MRHSPSAALLLVPVVVALISCGAGAASAPSSKGLPGVATGLALTGSSVAAVVRRPGTQCYGVSLWSAASLVSFPPLRGCDEGLSGGAGIGAVATSGTRAVWTAFACGNVCDWLLLTATPTRPTPRTLRWVSRADDGRWIVLGRGSAEGVPYAVNPGVGSELVLLADDGAARLKTSLDQQVIEVASGRGPGGALVAALLEDGTVAVLRPDGSVAATSTFPRGTVSALALAPLGIVVQVGRDVRLQAGDTVRLSTTLPAGARMLSYAAKRVLYAVGDRIRIRWLTSGRDVAVRTLAPLAADGPTLAGLSPTTLAWAEGARLFRTAAPR